jgi:hypothetical protein
MRTDINPLYARRERNCFSQKIRKEIFKVNHPFIPLYRHGKYAKILSLRHRQGFSINPSPYMAETLVLIKQEFYALPLLPTSRIKGGGYYSRQSWGHSPQA